MSFSKKILSVCRDIALFALLVFIISLWQDRNLLDDDGSVVIENRLLASLEGNTEPLLIDEQRTLIYFFAPWCKVCELSINNLDAIESSDIRVVRVALDYASKEQVQEFAQRAQVKGPILLGTQSMLEEFNVPGFPTYYYLDSQHSIVANAFGYSSELGLRLRNYFNQ